MIENQSVCYICGMFYSLSPSTNHSLKCIAGTALSGNNITRNLLLLRYFKTQRNFQNQRVKYSGDRQYREPSATSAYNCQ